jgi:hypothetical protein
MAKTSTLAIKIVGDATDAKRAFDDTEDHAGRVGRAFGGIGTAAVAGAAVAGAALVGFAKASFDAASELEQSTGAIDAVFGDWAVDIEQHAQEAAASVGLSTSAYENAAAVIGAQLHNAGMAHDEMTDKTTLLIQKGADMAAIFGGTATEAVDALSSALKGEMDPIERYGVSLNQSAIQAQLAADGNDKLTGAALKTAQTNAILELVTKQTADTQGAWAAQTGTAAEAQQILGAKLEDLQAKIGEKLLPVFASAASWVSDKLFPAFENLTRSGGPLSDMFATVSKFVTEQVVPAAKDLFKWYSEKVQPIFQDVAKVITQVAVPAFQAIWKFISDYVIPIFKTTLGPVIDGVRDFIHKLSEKIIENKDKFQEIWDKIKPFADFLRDKVAPIVGDVLGGAFKLLGSLIDPVVDTITWILDKASAVIGFVGKIGSFLFGGGDEHPAAATRGLAPLPRAAGRYGAPLSPLLFGAGTTVPGGGGVGPASPAGLTFGPAGDTYHITINGVLDADDAADEIARLLDRRARLTGRALAAAL